MCSCDLRGRYRETERMMDTADADMFKADLPPPPPPPSSSDQRGGDTAERSFIPYARQLIDQGRPSQALQVVVMALKNIGGEEAVIHALNRARHQYVTKLQATAAADELASLFAECAIAEALPSGTNRAMPPHHHTKAEPSLEPHGTSILAETGRSQIVLDAFSDGSSFVCLQCGGLVSNHRREEHYSFWCCN